ncbi:MAG: phosphoribosylformylglycinamidine synthase subunit PurQ [Pseudomonadota bacterium]|jgi:phosphoribosylformylglycinamidine synthase
MRVDVVVFPGTNGDHDVSHVVSRVLGHEAREIRWDEAEVTGDVVVLPGGFSYGDALRAGALAKQTPVMQAVAAFAARGGPVLGICNGFQILTEAGLLPGALLPNADGRFVSAPATVVVDGRPTSFTRGLVRGLRLSMPIAHGEGRYVADAQTLDTLEAEGRVVLRYAKNPNGSMRDIAGVSNAAGNVVGLMPHPERAAEKLLGSDDGLALFRAVLG